MEYDAERGSEEIASCLYDWVLKMWADPKNRFNRLRVFMDNCAGRKYFFHCNQGSPYHNIIFWPTIAEKINKRGT